jgi:O-antigen/teichoic acid export membrane protein
LARDPTRLMLNEVAKPERQFRVGMGLRLREALVSLRRSSFAQNAGWMFAGQGISVVSQSLYFMALARLLGSRQYGVLAAAAAMVGIASQYSSMGSGLLFLRYVSPDHTRFREFWGNILLSISIFGGLIVGALSLAGPWMVGRESASILVIVALGDCFCAQLVSCASQVFQTFERMRVTAVLNVLSNLLRLVLAGLMLLSLKVATARQWATASLCLSVIAALTAFFTVTRQFGWPTFKPRLLVSSAAEGFTFAVSGSTTAVYNDVDKVMMGHYGMNVANGIYSMAYRVVNIATMPVMSIHGAAFPRFFRAGVGGAAATEPLARRILAKTLLIGLAGATAMFLLAPLIPLFVGRGFSQSVNAVRWLCLIPVFRCFHLSAGDAISGAGYQKFRLTSQASAAAVNFGMNLYLIPRFSWVGAAWASLATDALLGCFNWAVLWGLLRKRTGVPAAVEC